MHKVIHYRQVRWINADRNLTALLQSALAARPNVDQTRFMALQETVELRHREQRGTAICLHFATHVVGARRGISPQAHGVPNSDLGEATAPASSEFTEREVAVVVKANKLAFVAMGRVRAGFVERAVRGLIGLEAGMPIANELFLAAHADPAMVASLISEGISKLDMGLDLSEIEADQQIETQPRPWSGVLGSSIRNALSTRIQGDFDEEDIDRLAMANVRLVLNFRKTAHLDKIQSLTDLASQVIEDDEEFKIKTLQGNDYSREQLLLKGGYTQNSAIAYLEYSTAWAHSISFLDGLN